MEKSKHEKIMDIASKRGFFYPSAEIYGSKSGFWTYGSLGTKIKHKWENLWRKYFLSLDSNFYEIDDVNILPKKVFESSGHLKNFNDPLTECEKCHFRFKADQLIEKELKISAASLNENDLTKMIRENKLKCSNCKGNLSDVRFFNMMFDVKVGAVGEDLMYLRPESAQSPYLSFKREFEASRRKLPLGLAVIGKAFRNEISPRQGFFRLREFTQAELQIFFDPDKLNKHEDFNSIKGYKLILHIKNKTSKISCDDVVQKLKLPKFYVYYLSKVQRFYLEILKINENLFRFRELGEKERAFYNKIHFDMELDLESLGGFKEVGGVHFRGSYDLSKHQEGSGSKLEVTIEENGKSKKVLPNVLELSFGVDRNIWALLDIFYKEEKERTLFNFPKIITPLDAAIFPLVNKDGLLELSEQLFINLRNEGFNLFFDSNSSIGRRYRRIDEIGCLIGVTLDYQTKVDSTVTIRDGLSMKQIRVKMSDLKNVLNKLLKDEKIEKIGKII